MSATDRTTPVTRRRVIGTGTLAALAASLIGTTTTPPVAAKEAPGLTVTISLAARPETISGAWLAAWKQERDEASVAFHAAMQAAQDRIGGMEGQALVFAIESTHSALNDLDTDLLLEQMCAHLPGIASAIRAVWQHTVYSRPDSHDALGMCCQS